MLWIQLGQKIDLKSIKPTYLRPRPNESIKIETNGMKLQYFLKCPLLITTKQNHKIQMPFIDCEKTKSQNPT